MHRLRALDLLGKFLDLGPWAVNLVSVCMCEVCVYVHAWLCTHVNVCWCYIFFQYNSCHFNSVRVLCGVCDVHVWVCTRMNMCGGHAPVIFFWHNYDSCHFNCVCVFVFVHSYYCTLYLLHIHMSFSGTVSGNISVCAEIAAKFCQRAASSAGVSLGQDHGC